MNWPFAKNKKDKIVESVEHKTSVIALHGPSGAGKNEFANGLLANYPVVKTFAFADKLREFVYASDPFVEVWEPGGAKYYRLKDVVDSLGWDEAKKIPDVRRCLQRTATEAGQTVIDKHVWANLVRDQMYAHILLCPNAVCVITDLRFPHELFVLNSMRNIDLTLVKVIGGKSNDSLKTPETKLHISEQWSLPYHYLIDNDLKEMSKGHLHAYAGAIFNMAVLGVGCDGKPELKNDH